MTTASGAGAPWAHSSARASGSRRRVAAGLLCLGCLGLMAGSRLGAAQTESYTSAAQAMPLLGRLGSARLAGLGYAFHPLVTGPDALLGNPAGLPGVRLLSVGVHHETWLADTRQETLFAVTPVGADQSFGAYAHVIDYGPIELRDANGQRQGELAARDYVVGAAWGLRAGGGFSGGLGLRGVRQSLVQRDDFSLGLDGGLAWEGEDGWSGGLVAQHVGAFFGGGTGAESVRWGVGRLWGRAGGMLLWPALAFSWQPYVAPKMQLGVEWRVADNFDLRVGYQHRFAKALVDGVQGLALGLGLRVAGFQVDYAYLPQGDVGEGQRLSLRYTQAAPSPVRPPVLFPVLHNSVASEPGVRPAPTPTLVAIFHELRDPLEEARRLEEEGRLGEALTEYERVATERPDLAGAWRGLADLAYRLKKRDKAVRAYRQLLVLEPSTELEHWLDTYIHAAEP